MSKKYISTRELKLLESWTRELVQDVSKQYILYYAILIEESGVHDVYDEATVKTFADPVMVNARVEFDEGPTKAGGGTIDAGYTMTAYCQPHELTDRNVHPREGDFVEYGQVMFEISSVRLRHPAFGQMNEKVTVQLDCVPSREGQFKADNVTADAVDNTHPVEPRRVKTLGDDL